MARTRATLIRELRSFFSARGYLEVDTPQLAPALIPEPHLEVFETFIRTPYHGETGGPESARYLVPSPEVWMKELLAAGYESIFQISHCFRNSEASGPHHSHEFTMLEWYTAGADYLASADRTDELLGHLCREMPDPPSTLRPPARRMTIAEAFDSLAGLSPDVFDSVERMRDAAQSRGVTSRPGADESYDDLFQRLFLTLVEDRIPADRPVILTDYPSIVPTLAVQKDGAPFAERWELYLSGIEVANCYTEEREPGKLREYLDSASRAKRSALVPHPPCLIEEFSRAQACSGVALGVDRLLMALTGARDIRDVIFPTSFCIFRSPQRRRG